MRKESTHADLCPTVMDCWTPGPVEGSWSLSLPPSWPYRSPVVPTTLTFARRTQATLLMCWQLASRRRTLWRTGCMALGTDSSDLNRNVSVLQQPVRCWCRISPAAVSKIISSRSVHKSAIYFHSDKFFCLCLPIQQKTRRHQPCPPHTCTHIKAINL